MNKISNYKNLLDKVDEVTKQKGLDLSSGEDLSIGIMNLISIEEHLFFTYNKTKDIKFIELLDEVRRMRTELLKEIIKDYKGEVWCISKHLLAASMRIMEVGTKELKKASGPEGLMPGGGEHKKKAASLFEKSYNLYSLFWGLNLGVVGTKDLPAGRHGATRNTKDESNLEFIDEKGEEKDKDSVFSKLGSLVQKAIDCCRE